MHLGRIERYSHSPGKVVQPLSSHSPNRMQLTISPTLSPRSLPLRPAQECWPSVPRPTKGMDVLDAVLDGTVAILGPSGAGKSTLANALLADTTDADRLETGRVRTGDGKGRHTTVTRELISFSGGRTLIDTPGLRGVGMWKRGGGDREDVPEIEELIAECRFLRLRTQLRAGMRSPERTRAWRYR